MSGGVLLYPLRFQPLCQYRPWGGRSLGALLRAPLPATGRIGEAWLLSDRKEFPSRVANGPLRELTVAELIHRYPVALLGRQASTFRRFPLLLKYLDVRDRLSVQVHPTAANAQLLPAGETGKTEAWIVMEARDDSRVYAGLREGTTRGDLRESLEAGHVTDSLASFVPKVGDCVLVPAGTVHALAGGLVVLELEQNSDVTFRLYDWGRIDPASGQPRPLQVEQAMACLDVDGRPVRPVRPGADDPAAHRETIFRCAAFSAWRARSTRPVQVGEVDVARVLVCTEGAAELEHEGGSCVVRRGDVVLLPAQLGPCTLVPSGSVEVVEIALPEADERANE